MSQMMQKYILPNEEAGNDLLEQFDIDEYAKGIEENPEYIKKLMAEQERRDNDDEH